MSVCLDYQSNHSALCVSGSIVQLPKEAPMAHQDANDFKDICVVRVINKAKFPVYLVNNKGDKKDYAMKVFGYAGNKPHPYFQNEARFSFLDHRNVIRTQYIENERETFSQGCKKKVSYTIMEYAPYGDFFDFMMNYGTQINDKLIRTYFRQLIKGLEYLHSNGVSHMDLKLENLLVGEKFDLKIADFDLSFLENDQRIVSKGTKFYRAPELIRGRCLDTQSADIYSLGVVLFTMKSRGMLPHAEENNVNGIDFAWLLYNNNQEFWKEHCKIQKKDPSFFDQDFKTLFNTLIKLNPKERASIDEIKQSAWFNGPYYTDDELRDLVSELMKINK